MSKKEFVDAYAKATGETKKRAEELVNQFLDTVEEVLLNGDSVQFVGWGTFEVKERAARTPATSCYSRAREEKATRRRTPPCRRREHQARHAANPRRRCRAKAQGKDR